MRRISGPESMGSPSDEPVGQRWVRSSPHHEGEGVLIHPPYQGDCGRHGTEEQRVTSGGLTESLGGTRVSGPISASEGASDALPVDGRLCSTTNPVKAAGPSNRRSEVDRGRQPAKTVGKRAEGTAAPTKTANTSNAFGKPHRSFWDPSPAATRTAPSKLTKLSAIASG